MDIIAPDYAGKTDDDLLRLAIDPESLSQEARDALSVELRKRNLNSPGRIETFASEERTSKHQDEINVRNLGLSFRGIGKKFYGKFNREVVGLREEYETDLFVVVFFFPLVPIGTYRCAREQNSTTFEIQDKKPLDWGQIALVWIKALAITFALFFTIPYVFEFLMRLKI